MIIVHVAASQHFLFKMPFNSVTQFLYQSNWILSTVSQKWNDQERAIFFSWVALGRVCQKSAAMAENISDLWIYVYTMLQWCETRPSQSLVVLCVCIISDYWYHIIVIMRLSCFIQWFSSIRSTKYYSYFHIYTYEWYRINMQRTITLAIINNYHHIIDILVTIITTSLWVIYLLVHSPNGFLA